MCLSEPGSLCQSWHIVCLSAWSLRVEVHAIPVLKRIMHKLTRVAFLPVREGIGCVIAYPAHISSALCQARAPTRKPQASHPFQVHPWCSKAGLMQQGCCPDASIMVQPGLAQHPCLMPAGKLLQDDGVAVFLAGRVCLANTGT